MNFTRTTLLLGLLAPGATASSLPEAAAQAPVDESYRLVQVAGQPLPVVTEQSGECRDELLAATLTLHGDGTWTLLTTEREVCGTTTEEEEDREEGRYTADGQALRFLDENGKPAVDDGDDSELEVDDLLDGTRSAEGLVVRAADGETELRFVR
jgi:hypothetical protein